MKKQRFSGVELLRIFMMVQIIFLHLCDKGGYEQVAQKLSLGHYYLYYFIWFLSRSPVYVFFILTGYFLVKKKMKLGSVIDRIKVVYKPMLFYSIVIAIMGVIFNIWSVKEVNIPKMFTPFISTSWYFLTGYILLIILSPFLNKLAKSLNKKEYLILLVILVSIFYVWVPFASLKPFSSFVQTPNVLLTSGGKSLYDYVIMYLIGGYFALHFKEEEKINYNYLIGFIACGIIQLSLYILVKDYKTVGENYNNIFVVMQSILLVLFFKNMNFYSKTVNYIATFTLPVYIIHEHYMLKWWFWDKVIHLDKAFFRSYIYPIKIILICLVIYIVCSIIDLIRRFIFKSIKNIGTYIQSKA